MKKLGTWINRVITGILMVLLVAVAGLVLLSKLSGGMPEIFGYQLKAVLSGSMEPGIQTGSVIAVKSLSEEERTQLQKGDVITFMEDENMLITHRVIDVKSTNSGVQYTTKGDNNNTPDSNPVLAENVVAEYHGFTVAYAGYLINFSQSPNGSILFMIIPGFLMLGYSLITIWRVLRQVEEKQKENPNEGKCLNL
ncbi:signal peptidase [Bacillus sp. SA1-12]|uniref:signal peptidase I SipW n=1 Tax=Bacillus sp. SA1-12 TaxID=1455638 RepID=UPI000625F6C4|nr:signal peptidase I [Bacillus sp. SA1-12]KKI93311.1 signal peptidase [Bacillus sp. SA1-12]